jgi:hypothetical protein
MLLGRLTVGRVGSSRIPTPPMVGSTYSTWACAGLATQRKEKRRKRNERGFMIMRKKWPDFAEYDEVKKAGRIANYL